MNTNKQLKIAILHEMLIKFWGAEKVVQKLLNIFPEAELFTLIYDENKIWKFFPKEKINKQCFNLKSQKIYNWTKNQRFCLTSMPISVESLDFSWYDVVIASSSWFTHWAITKPETKFVVYYHSPARYMWDWTNEYKKDIWCQKWIKWFILNKIFLKLRQWDYIASQRVDINIANSQNVANRITKYYRKKSEILYPPVETKRFENKNILNQKWWYYLIISALTEFKKIDVAIKAFKQMPNIALKIIWEWNYKQELETLANKDWHYERENNNIKFLWAKYWEELVEILHWCKWLIFPWEEDFWIVPIEAMASWKPVFAYYWWWLAETNIKDLTWDFFYNKDWTDFIENFKIFDENINNWFYKQNKIQEHSLNFDESIFEEKIKNIVYN